MANELYDAQMLEKTFEKGRWVFRLNDSFETAWLSQQGLADFFDVNRPQIIKALSHCFSTLNLDKGTHIRRVSFVDDALHAGKSKQDSQYSLLIICQCAFLLNSDIALAFQHWGLQLLARHLSWGSTVDATRVNSQDKRKQQLQRQCNRLKKSVSNDR